MEDRVAVLGNKLDMTSFSYAGKVIRFRTSRHLQRYTKIVEWDNGYLVVMARYDNSPVEEEEYIDLIPILQNLYMEPEEFLCDIEGVRIAQSSELLNE
ncbi:DUF7724 family protein [Selenomonas ruminantium]|uniref:DUF7724 domain-containing protein n=1 Tax=Selenomonas ruminantium TaxID=971 RepID=A0A1H3YUQ6_SELRU|nr:hypothetical protein [Selenomonas ruminantium]SEA14931.1 hypothetical protein SAMN05660648_02129 [Selenomonas ruminantium]